MTLDMPLWARDPDALLGSNDKPSSSQLRNLEVEQLIQLSVDNLIFFSDNRGRNHSKGTKFLSVLQGLDEASTDLWYNAVKGFEFEGWAFAGEPARLPNTMKLLRKMLDENKLDKTEWVHVLQNSPPIMTALYTAIQRSLSKAVGHKITLSCDSSSPHQAAGKIQEFLGFAESYFTTDKPDELHQQFEPIMKKLCRKKKPKPTPTT